MCLGEICQVIGHEPANRVRVRGEVREQVVSLMTLDGAVEPGDWLLVHSGFALQRVEAGEAREALDLREALAIRATPPLAPPQDSAPAVPAPAFSPPEIPS